MIGNLIDGKSMVADGFDEAILFVGEDGVVNYSANRMIEIMVERDGMTEEEAMEFFDFNIAGAHMGDMTPRYWWQQ